jgi:hypothetical protein
MRARCHSIHLRSIGRPERCTPYGPDMYPPNARATDLVRESLPKSKSESRITCRITSCHVVSSSKRISSGVSPSLMMIESIFLWNTATFDLNNVLFELNQSTNSQGVIIFSSPRNFLQNSIYSTECDTTWSEFFNLNFAENSETINTSLSNDNTSPSGCGGLLVLCLLGTFAASTFVLLTKRSVFC